LPISFLIEKLKQITQGCLLASEVLPVAIVDNECLVAEIVAGDGSASVDQLSQLGFGLFVLFESELEKHNFLQEVAFVIHEACNEFVVATRSARMLLNSPERSIKHLAKH